MEILHAQKLGPWIQIPNRTRKSVSGFLFVLSCLRTTVPSFKQCYQLYTNKIPIPKMGDRAAPWTPAQRGREQYVTPMIGFSGTLYLAD